NLLDHGLGIQQSVEAPRVASYSFPATGHPHPYDPGLLRAEPALSAEIVAELAERGHRVEHGIGADFEGFGSLCAIWVDREKGTLVGAADNRREAYAIGW